MKRCNECQTDHDLAATGCRIPSDGGRNRPGSRERLSQLPTGGLPRPVIGAIWTLPETPDQGCCAVLSLGHCLEIDGLPAMCCSIIGSLEGTRRVCRLRYEASAGNH